MRPPIESATTCPVRSTSIAELIAVIPEDERMTCVSLVKSPDRISTVGLSSTKSYSRRVPMTKAATILPRLRSFRAPVTTPVSTRSTTASVNISVWIPRSRWPVSAAAVAAGIAPIDIADQPGRVLVRRDIDLDREVDGVNMDEALAQGPRHRRVELDDNRLRGAHR